MLCCLLFSLLMAQVAAACRRGRARLGGLVASTVSGRLRLSRQVLWLTLPAITVAAAAYHWDHLAGEARALLGLAPATALPAQEICGPAGSPPGAAIYFFTQPPPAGL